MGSCFGPPSRKLISFADFELQAVTGDVLLFAGTGLISRFIEYASLSKYSHAGTVIKNEKTKQVFVLESSIIDVSKDIYGDMKNGVRLIPAFNKFQDYINNYGPGFYWIKLRVPKDINPANYKYERNINWVKENYYKPYEGHVDELAYAAWPIIPEGILAFTNGPKSSPTDSYFCSELSVDHLKFLEAANPDIKSTTVAPSAFDTMYPLVRGVPLLKPGYYFDPPISVGFM